MTLLLGAKQDECKELNPYFDSFSKNIIYLEDRCKGLVAKICNNFILACSMVGTCEAMYIAKKYGIETELLREVLNVSSGKTWVSECYSPAPSKINVPANHNYDIGYKSELMLKDLKLASKLFESVNLNSVVLNEIETLYETLCDRGNGKKDLGIYFSELEVKIAGGI